MYKYLLTFAVMLTSITANAFEWSSLNPFSSSEKAETIEMPNAENVKIKAMTSTITDFFDSGSIMNITDDQKQMLKTSYDYLKSQEIADPKLKEMADKAITLVDESKIFEETSGFYDSLM